ncbi:hypothetical protein [Streptomyces sp. NPDC005969]|uniref:hypothetical protein n=1 Tax=Streptomyces sp. NPDC005969 TaxID=3156722 RepID=UPI0033E1BFC7
MTLCETGTRVLIGAVFGPVTKGETDDAHDLVGHPTSDMLLLANPAFDSNELLADIAAEGAPFLIRATSVRHPPVLALLPDDGATDRRENRPCRGPVRQTGCLKSHPLSRRVQGTEPRPSIQQMVGHPPFS